MFMRYRITLTMDDSSWSPPQVFQRYANSSTTFTRYYANELAFLSKAAPDVSRPDPTLVAVPTAVSVQPHVTVYFVFLWLGVA